MYANKLVELLFKCTVFSEDYKKYLFIMKFNVSLLFTFLLFNSTSSFYRRFRGAFSNVERGFSKLLKDVVFDVQDTVHCTISAVEEVLGINGHVDERYNYNHRCRGYALPKNIPVIQDNGHGSYFVKPFENPPPRHLSSETELGHISHELENSILNVNKSINDILRIREHNNNMKFFSEILKDETKRLYEVRDLLRRELENISINIRNEIEKLHMGHKKPPEDMIWENIQALNDLKCKSNNKTEINEITNVIDKVVNELNVTPSEKVLSENEKMEEIKKQLNKYSSGKQNDQKIFNTKEIVQNEIRTEKEIKTFKDVAQSIMKDDDKKMSESNILNRDSPAQGSNTEKPLFDMDLASIDISNPFYNPNLSSDTKKIVEDAKYIMEESMKSEELINNFFKEHNNGNEDVFSNSDMFNFG